MTTRFAISFAAVIFAAGAGGASAGDLDLSVCEKPIAQLNLEQIENCQNARKIMQGVAESWLRLRAGEQAEEDPAIVRGSRRNQRIDR